MREIKFRAWDKKNKEMLVPDGNGYFSSDNHLCFVIDGNGEPIYLDDLTTPEDIVFMQYTGLKDKHNKEIYEGDLLSVVIEGYKQAEPYIVEDMCDLYFECQREDNYYRHQIKKCEIIGNKYENPEVLEDKT